MKQNPCPIVGEVAKPTGVGLDELDGAIEPFCTGIADFVAAVVEQADLMVPEHPDHLFDRLQAAPHGVAGPRIKELLGRTFVAVAPEPGELLLDGPGQTGLEVELIQGTKGDGLGAAPIRITSEPRPFTARQWRCTVTVLELRHARFDDGLKLTGVQVSPLALTPTVHVSPLGSVGGVGPHLPLLENNLDTTTCWSANDRSTVLTDHGVFSPRSCSYSAVSFMLWLRNPKNRILRESMENHSRIDEEPF